MKSDICFIDNFLREFKLWNLTIEPFEVPNILKIQDKAKKRYYEGIINHNPP